MDLPSTVYFQGWQIRYSLMGDQVKALIFPGRRQVIFVHGTPWSSIVYKPIIDALRAKRPNLVILAYDLPGYGQSQNFDPNDEDSKPEHSSDGIRDKDQMFDGDTSVKFQALALAALLEDLCLDGKNGNARPAVIAHDIAGAIVLRAHLMHGCNFESMMLLDTNAILPWGDGFYKLARQKPKTFLNLPPTVHESVVRGVIKSACYNPKVLSNDWEDLLVAPWIDNPAGKSTGERQRSFVRQIAQANDQDVSEMLSLKMYEQVRCNVKIISGEEDKWIPKWKIEDLAKRLKGKVKELAFIPKAGHLVMLDQPERVAIEIFEWLSR